MATNRYSQIGASLGQLAPHGFSSELFLPTDSVDKNSGIAVIIVSQSMVDIYIKYWSEV